MSDDPKVCVAICNYNHTKYLRQSLESIVNQTHKNLDITVVDDGSEDQLDVKRIVESLNDKRIRFVSLGTNRGKWNALNVAFSTTDAPICTSHDADDFSLSWRIESQLKTLIETNTAHNLCGFISCWTADELNSHANKDAKPDNFKIVAGEEVTRVVMQGYETSGINHYFTGNFETAGVSSMFLKKIWDIGFRFNPPRMGIRTLLSEDSDFNFRVTAGLRSTSILLEKPYLYRRNTSTNREER